MQQVHSLRSEFSFGDFSNLMTESAVKILALTKANSEMIKYLKDQLKVQIDIEKLIATNFKPIFDLMKDCRTSASAQQAFKFVSTYFVLFCSSVYSLGQYLKNQELKSTHRALQSILSEQIISPSRRVQSLLRVELKP